MKRRIPVAALLLAAVPVLRWYAARMQDGGGEAAGLVPLLFASCFLFRARREIASSTMGRGSGIAVLLAYAVSFQFLPPLIRAVMFIVAVALVTGVWRKPGIVLLLILSLPLAASLDFFFGYPLRLVTSVAAENLLGLAGLDVGREGVVLLHGENVVGVDPACSGLNMLWTAGLFTGLLASAFSLGWRKIFPLGLAALAISLAANSIRASLLFFPESGLIEMPHILHPVIGLVIAALALAGLAKLARGLADREKPSAAPPSPHSPLALTIAAVCAAAAPLFSMAKPPDEISSAPPLHRFGGQPVTQVALTAAEENFYADFPGYIAVYEGDGFKLTVRHVTRATRKLHPASHCLRAEGFSIGEKTTRTDDAGGHWLTYTATRNGIPRTVRERIRRAEGGGQWAEISAWYWSAFLRPSDGPWVAETVIGAQ
ncbi:archaeosortase/exosortase family protein [Akkermansiaceae bacterium]|nr:archaeosortase/exosortase family protein [Akkermansiaceae bacterium]